MAGPVSSVLASKCLKGKPATVGRAGEACLLLIELEQQEAVLESVLKAFADKVPKVVLAAVDIVLQAVRCVSGCIEGHPAAAATAAAARAGPLFRCGATCVWKGCGHVRQAGAWHAVTTVLHPDPDMPPSAAAAAAACSSFGARGALDAKPLFKALPALFTHTQAGVRDKAKETAVELCAYLGVGVVGGVLLDKMPAAMRKDVDAAIAELPPGKKQPARFTRREAADRAAREAEAGPMDVDGGEVSGEGAAAGEQPADEEEQVRKLASPALLLLRLLLLRSAELVSRQQYAVCLLPLVLAWLCCAPPSQSLDFHPLCLQEGDPYDFASPVDILAPLGKAQCQVDDDPPVPFWDALEAKKWGLRKVGAGGGGLGCLVGWWVLAALLSIGLVMRGIG